MLNCFNKDVQLDKIDQDTNKRILIVLYYYYPYVSGVSIYAKLLAEELAKRGYIITILTSRFEKDLPRKEYINNVLVIRRPILFRFGKGVIMPSFWLDVIRYASKNDYVNAHLPMPDTGISSLFISKKKLITTYQCDINLVGGLIDKFILITSYFLMNILLERSKSIITLSKDYFVNSKMKRYSRKAHQVYPPILTSEFKKIDSSQLLIKLGLRPNQIKIGFVGRVVYEKGIKYLFESIPFLARYLDNFIIIIAGDYSKVAGGSIKDELDAYVKIYPDRIMFTGYIDDSDLKEFYSLIDVLVLPSIDPLEAFGIVQVEAMLCGTPVVATNLPGVREVIKRTGYGLLSNAKDPEDIARKILCIINNKPKYTPIRNNVVKIFNQKEAIEAYINEMS